MTAPAAENTDNTDDTAATFINVFPVRPRDQHRLVELLMAAHENYIRHRPGYLSTSIHRGVDGYQVVDYTRWRRREDFEAMVRDPAAVPHFAPIGELTKGEQKAYDVVFSHEKGGVARRAL
ncbi:antibiotic biosynthesis monooxygenase [Streptomyces sp. B1866]|uniref:antibiotic biosynthesis monooxygenase family protein n=1 Tax=Streptomyces sp. B1866 TaxID=3075431 RepID=UPI00288D0B81|nr:antibiotic biosynthesis monooxygenase [Streptomyces sp. B1866]MDT3397090.1 antibiotic biosynthesis monooxygenase [Streptomyces sp. B1866]